MINFVDAGGKVNDPNAGAFNSNLIANLLAATTGISDAETPAGHGTVGSERYGPHIYFPPGNYYFNQQITINKAVTLTGQDGATRAGHMTAFLFPAGSMGIVINSHDTNGLTNIGDFQNPGGGGSGTVIEGIMVEGVRGANNLDQHGILVRAYCVLKNVGAQHFAGHGIYIFADGDVGQASNCMLMDCSANGNAGSGLKLFCGDANIVSVIGGDYSNNRDWGIEDFSFLGCTFSGIHFTGNGWGQNGVLLHNNVPWVLRPFQDTNAASVQPGTNEQVWTRYFEDVAPGRPTWPNVTGVRSCGAFITIHAAAESVWTGCYTEGSQSGSFVGPRALVVGGDHGAGVYALDMNGSGEPSRVRAVGNELVTRTTLRMKSVHLGLTRDRGDNGQGMKMSAASGPPVFGEIRTQKLIWITHGVRATSFGTKAASRPRPA